jgi:hypothetical protein
MKIVELILDEQQLATGIEAISIVESPAIESNFIALNKQHKLEFKAMDSEKRVLLGPALIPNKPIYRHQELNGKEEEFYVYFSKATIEKASQLYMMRGNQAKTTIEHQFGVDGAIVVETWLKVDEVNDKSVAYGFNDPVGTWYVAMKIVNDEIWNDFVKTGKVKGFSIEGFFADKSMPTEMSKVETEQDKLDKIVNILKEYINGK